MNNNQAYEFENPCAFKRWFALVLNILAWPFLIGAIVCKGFVNSAYGFSNIDILPAAWCFYTMWGIIYVFQIGFLVYGATYLFRKDKDKVLFFQKTNHVHFSFYILATISYMSDIAWGWTNWSPIANFITMFFMMVTQWPIVFASMIALQKRLRRMEELNMWLDVVLTRLLVENACGTFATWATIQFWFAFANIITNQGAVDGIAMSTVSIGIVLALLLIYFIFDVFFFLGCFLYQFTPYLVVIFTFVGVIASEANSGTYPGYVTRDNIFEIVIVSLALVFLLVKLILPIFCWAQIATEEDLIAEGAKDAKHGNRNNVRNGRTINPADSTQSNTGNAATSANNERDFRPRHIWTWTIKPKSSRPKGAKNGDPNEIWHY